VAILDTSRIYVGRDIDSSVVVLDQSYGTSDSIAIRCVSRYDVILTNGAAVNLITQSS
jgi:hypothetical protein